MATLTFSAGGGTITAQISASNGQAARTVDAYLARAGYDISGMDDQAKADAFMVELKRHVKKITETVELADLYANAKADVDSTYTPVSWT